MMDLDALRLQREAEAAEKRAQVDRWLQVASIALGAVLRGAHNGDPDCLAALPRIEALMPEKFRPLCPSPIVPGEEKEAAAAKIVVEFREQRGPARADAQADESFTEGGA